MVTNNENAKSLYKDTMIKYLTELEDHRRKERRLWLNEQGIRLGRVSSMRQGSKIVEIWEEGDQVIKLQNRLKEIADEREEIKKRQKRKPRVPEFEASADFDLEESEFNNIDKDEQKEIYQFKQKLFENEERRIREQLYMLEKEKC